MSRFERNRKKKKVPQTKLQKQLRFWLRVVILLAVLLVIALTSTGIYKGTRHPSVTLTTIDVQGGETIDHEVIRHRARELLKGTYLFLVPRTFAYFYPEEEIRAAIARIPRVHNVSVHRDSPTSIEVTFSEYVPIALWCDSLSATSTEPCLFVDRTGYAFSEAPHLTGSTFIRFVTENREPLVDETILSPQRLFALGEFMEALKERHEMRISAITLTDEGDVTYHLVGGGEILVVESASIQDTFDTLESLLRAEQYAHLEPGDFEYIDLRFNDKVYIREAGAATSTETGTASTSTST